MYSLVSELEAERKNYGATMTNDECVALLNAVLWQDARKGYKLVEKKRGNNGRRADGALCSVDGIVWVADRTFIDVLVDAGGVSRPTWQVHTIGKVSPKGNIYRPHAGPLVDPIEPPGVIVPSDPPDDPEEPQVTQAELDAVMQLIKALGERITALDKRLTAVERNLTVPVEMLTRIEALEHAEYRLVGDAEAPPISSSRLRTNLTVETRARVVRVR